ncbi:MAG TPA: hypothetical protein PLC76_09920 [Saprospiraceae bacterium]|jgi:hypothetical protein|nr:MAG: hypothetical protein UZ08_BCD001003019 [Candidatus Parvibacillus calidus]MBX2937130.1 hypothetical protein [Saprospiraceae bacterium]MBK7741292.1 hypothetical protein [Candidatus Parvibacillus calidus]MBX7178587.1 hypothetical protein [Saprospiraceae bacterium]MCB0592191.1 hypothetical protein [Saprospiraceae bacterium]
MKIKLSFYFSLCCILIACSSEKSNNAIKDTMTHFSINGKDVTAYRMTNKDQFDASNKSNYASVGANEDISLTVDLPKDVDMDVAWYINGSEMKGSSVKTKFPIPETYEVVLQIPGFEEVVKYIIVEEQSTPVDLAIQDTVTQEMPTTENLPETAPKEVEVKKENKPLPIQNREVQSQKKQPSVVKNEKIETKKVQKRTTPSSEVNTQPEIVDGPPPPPKRVVTESSPSKSPPVKSEPTTGFNNKKTEGAPKPGSTTDVSKKKTEESSKSGTTIDLNNKKTEGAPKTEPCKTATYSSTASVSLKPKQDIELSSFYVYAAQSGNVDIILMENNKQVDKLVGRHVNAGMTQLRVSTLNTTLKGGKVYVLKITGHGGITFANLAPCGVGGGGSILNPSYPGGVSIFNIHFNY